MAFTGEVVKVVTRLHVRSGIVDDFPVMDLHFVPPAGWGASEAGDLADVLEAFWNTVPTGGSANVANFLGKSISNGATHDVFFYEVPSTPGPTGAPLHMDGFTTPTVGTDQLPEEVASCMSFHSSYGLDVEFGPGRTTRPRARHRNRMYIGPLSTSALTEDSASHATFIAPGFASNVVKSAQQQLQTAATVKGWLWCTFSKTGWSRETLADGTVWMDNAFDTQRRRGRQATARVSGSL